MTAIQRLQEGCQSGGSAAYESLQYFKTVLNRKMNAKRLQEGFELIREGTLVCCQYPDAGVGGLEVAVQVFPLFDATGVNVSTPDALPRLLQLSQVFADTRPSEHGASAVRVASKYHQDFLHSALRWCQQSKAALEPLSTSPDLAPLYTALAVEEAICDDRKSAYAHYLNGVSPSSTDYSRPCFERYVLDVSQQLAASPERSDSAALFIARAVLHLAARKPSLVSDPHEQSSVTSQNLRRARNLLTASESILSRQQTNPWLAFCDVLLRLLLRNHERRIALSLLPKHGGDDDPQLAAIATAVDSLLDVFMPVLQSPDAHFKSLALAVVQNHDATQRHIKAASPGSILSTFLSMVQGSPTTS